MLLEQVWIFFNKPFFQVKGNRTVAEVVPIKLVVRWIFQLIRILKYREENVERSLHS